MQRADHAARGRDERMVVRVERLRNDDLVAVIQKTVAGDLKRLAAAGGDENIAVLQLHADAVIIALYGLQQRRNAGRGRVSQRGLMEIADSLK